MCTWYKFQVAHKKCVTKSKSSRPQLHPPTSLVAHVYVIWLFARGICRTQHIVILMVIIYLAKGYKAISAKGKGTMSNVWTKPCSSFQESSLSRSPKMHLIPSPCNKLWQYIWIILYQGNSLGSQYVSILWGVWSHRHPCLAYRQILDSQKERGHSV